MPVAVTAQFVLVWVVELTPAVTSARRNGPLERIPLLISVQLLSWGVPVP